MDSKKLYIRIILNNQVVSDYTMKQIEWIKVVDQLNKSKNDKTIFINGVKEKLSNFIITFSDSKPFDYIDQNKIDFITSI